MESIRQFYEKKQEELSSARDLILATLKTRKDLFYQRKKEGLLKSVLSSFHRQSSRAVSLEQENRGLYGMLLFDVQHHLTLMEKYAELFLTLSKDGYKEDYQDFIKQILVIAKEQQLLMAGFFSSDSVKKGMSELRLSEFRLQEVVNQACILNESLARSKNITLHFTVNPQLEKIRSDLSKMLYLMNCLLEQMLCLAQEGSDLMIQIYPREGYLVVQLVDDSPVSGQEDLKKLISVESEEEESSLRFALIRKLSRQLEGHLDFIWEENRKAALILEFPNRIS